MPICIKCNKMFKKSGGKGCREKLCGVCWAKSQSINGKKGARLSILNRIERRSTKDARI